MELPHAERDGYFPPPTLIFSIRPGPMTIRILTEPEVQIVPLMVVLRDLDALRSVCRRRGWEFRTGQQTYRPFGGWVDTRPRARGIRPSALGPCAHAIGVPGCL